MCIYERTNTLCESEKIYYLKSNVTFKKYNTQTFEYRKTSLFVSRSIKVYSKLDDRQRFFLTAPVAAKTLKDKAKLISEYMFKKCRGKSNQ